MSQQVSPDQNQIDARRYQQAFDLYFLGLTFTILALSIQTATFGDLVTTDVFELLAWELFLISGLSGLWRGLWTPNLYNLFGTRPALIAELEEIRKGLREAKEDENTPGYEDYVTPLREALDKIEIANQYIDKVQEKVSIYLEIQKICFVLGLLSLIIARAYQPVLGIIKNIRAMS